jgi:hypothetical protein
MTVVLTHILFQDVVSSSAEIETCTTLFQDIVSSGMGRTWRTEQHCKSRAPESTFYYAIIQYVTLNIMWIPSS